jgi:hypothetical protein
MNFAITDDQEMLRRSFARYLEENSSTVRVRAGFQCHRDGRAHHPSLWQR